MAKYKFGNDILDFDSEDDAIQYAEETGASVFEPIATESPEEMRQRAKSEYAADVMRQRMEYDKENPYLTKIFPGATEAVKSDAPWYIQSAEAAKDLFSGPGRGLMATSDYALDKLWKERPTFEEEQQIRQEHPIAMGIADFGKNIVESPLNIPLIPLGAIGAGTTGLRALGAGLGRVGATAGLVAGDIYSGKAVQGQEMTPGDYGVALASGLLPEAATGITKGIRYVGEKLQPLFQGAATKELAAKYPDLYKLLYETHADRGWTEKELMTQAEEAELGKKIADNIKKFAGGIIGMGTGATIGGVTGGGVGATVAAPLGGFIGERVGQMITTPALESAAFRASRVPQVSQNMSSLVTPHIVPRAQPDMETYNADIIEAMRNNLLTESEYKAYQNPANMQRFYQRFPR